MQGELGKGGGASTKCAHGRVVYDGEQLEELKEDSRVEAEEGSAYMARMTSMPKAVLELPKLVGICPSKSWPRRDWGWRRSRSRARKAALTTRTCRPVTTWARAV